MGVMQIVFNPVSAAEVSQLPKLLQLEILSHFQGLKVDDLDSDPKKFAVVRKGERVLYRFRAKDYRIYFEKGEQGLLIRRVLNKNSFKDFLYRSQLSGSEDEDLQDDPKFWDLIDGKK